MFHPELVDGANLSMGDLHFSQGDGEITFCGAIEVGGFINLHVDGSTVYLPTAIFDTSLAPSVGGPAQIDPGTGVPRSSS